MYKLLVFDLDDTLLKADKTIDALDLKAIKKAKEKGSYIVIATGRIPSGIKKYVDEIGLDESNYIICFNGALAQTVDGNTILYKNQIKGSDLHYLYELSLKAKTATHVFDKRGCFTNKATKYSILETTLNDTPLNIVDYSTIADDDDIIKVLFTEEADILDKAISEFPKEIYDKYNIVKSAPFFLEFLNKKADKWYGVEAVAKELGIKNEEIICFGDSENDALMIEKCGLGIAMGNAIPSVKKVTKYITDDCSNNGIAKAIEKFILKA